MRHLWPRPNSIWPQALDLGLSLPWPG